MKPLNANLINLFIFFINFPLISIHTLFIVTTASDNQSIVN